MVKNTYGTGCFMLMNTGSKPIPSKNNLLTTIAWRIGDRTEYALEGSIFIAGAVVQWLRDGLGIIKSSAEVEALAAQVTDTGEFIWCRPLLDWARHIGTNMLAESSPASRAAPKLPISPAPLLKVSLTR